MKLIVCLLLASLSFSLTGCKPDAAVERGATVGAGPGTPETQKKFGAPIVTEPKTNKTQPLNKVQ